MDKIIYIIRHAETDLNKKGMVQGRGIDTDINECGRKQAEAFFQAYKNIPFDKIYTSTLKRTHQTVKKFIDKGIPWTQFEGLDEIAWGVFEGRENTEDVKLAYEKLTQGWSAGKLDAKFENGETPLQVLERQKDVVKEIIQDDGSHYILICMHGRAMRLFLCLLTHRSPSEMQYFPHTNTALYKLKYDGQNFRITEFNNTDHLKKINGENTNFDCFLHKQ